MAAIALGFLAGFNDCIVMFGGRRNRRVELIEIQPRTRRSAGHVIALVPIVDLARPVHAADLRQKGKPAPAFSRGQTQARQPTDKALLLRKLPRDRVLLDRVWRCRRQRHPQRIEHIRRRRGRERLERP
jgi:hypothetical protein